jgi:hypothetical protein
MPPKKLKYERQTKQKDSKLFSIFLAFSLLVTSGLAFGVSYFSLHNEIPALYKSVVSRGWTKTEGKIVKTYTSTKSVRTGSAKNPGSALVYVPNVNYSFEVGNETFTGSRINFSAEEKYFSLLDESKKYLDSVYQVNQKTEVFYDPNNPQESTLSREYVYQFGDYQAGCCCGSIGILCSLLFWFSIRDLIKTFRKQKNDDRQ